MQGQQPKKVKITLYGDPASLARDNIYAINDFSGANLVLLGCLL